MDGWLEVSVSEKVAKSLLPWLPKFPIIQWKSVSDANLAFVSFDFQMQIQMQVQTQMQVQVQVQVHEHIVFTFLVICCPISISRHNCQSVDLQGQTILWLGLTWAVSSAS